MGKHQLGPNRKIIDRRKKVMRLRFVKRWPIDQIAQVLDVSTRTIERDIKAIVEHNNIVARDELSQPVERTLWEATENYYERQMLRWQEFANAKDPGIKNRILRDIQADDEQHYKLLQSLGVVERVPDQAVVTTESWEERVRRLRSEREAVAEAAGQNAGEDEE